MWLREVCSCSCSSVLPAPAWALLSKICIPFSRSLYVYSKSCWVTHLPTLHPQQLPPPHDAPARGRPARPRRRRPRPPLRRGGQRQRRHRWGTHRRTHRRTQVGRKLRRREVNTIVVRLQNTRLCSIHENWISDKDTIYRLCIWRTTKCIYKYKQKVSFA